MKKKTKIDQKREIRLEHGFRYVLIILILSSAVLFGVIAFMKYRSFSFQDIDLALLNQTTWNTLQGRLLSLSQGQATLLNGGHVFIIIFFILPFYALFTSPLTLLFLQSLMLALGAWPLYLLARDLIKPIFGLIFAFAYLIYPALNWVNLYEFHYISFSTPLLLWMAYYFSRRRFILFFLFMVLALFCREDVSIPVFALGVFILSRNIFKTGGRKWDYLKWGVVPILTSLIWFALCVKVIQPSFSPPMTPDPGIVEQEQGWLKFYDWMRGESFFDTINNIISSPQGIFSKPKLLYMLHLLLPVGFLPIFSPSGILMVLISLSEGLLSSRFSHFSIRYQYSSIITPLIFISAIYGLKNLLDRLRIVHKVKIVLAGILLFSLFSAFKFGPLFNLPEGFRRWSMTAEDKFKQKLMDLIPLEVPVIATFEFTPGLSMRPELFYFYHVYAVSRHPKFLKYINLAQNCSRYALIDFNDFLTFYDFYTPGGDRDILKFLTEGNWELLTTVSSIALFKKAKEPAIYLIERNPSLDIKNPVNLDVLQELKLLGYNLNKNIVLGEKIISLEVYFQCLQPLRVNFLLSVQFQEVGNSQRQFKQVLFAPYQIYPTSRWLKGEVIKQSCNLLLPEDMKNGQYNMSLVLLVQQGRGFSGKIIFHKDLALNLP